MNDLNTLAGGPRAALVVGGERYEVYELTLGELGEVQAWVNDQFADPLELAQERLGRGLTPNQEQFLLRAALELAAKPRALLGTPEADELVRSSKGTQFVLWLSIKKGRPGFTREMAEALFDSLRPTDLARAFGGSGVEAVLGDPKATGAGGTA